MENETTRDGSGWGGKEYHVLAELTRLSTQITDQGTMISEYMKEQEEHRISTAIAIAQLTERAKVWGAITGFAGAVIVSIVRELIQRK